MSVNPYGEAPRESAPPVYEVTDRGLVQAAGPVAPRVQGKPLFGSILLQACLLGALVAYFLDGRQWYESAERWLEARARARMIEPYRAWAVAHPQSYDEVAASGLGFIGKSVIWDFVVEESTGPASYYYCAGDPMKRVAWASGEAELREKAVPGAPFKALARIEGSLGELPLLSPLE
ncbi:MAG: hypothetical protein HY924_09370 [Elusimicrobia bacterium]|nr:hypothetical protein [Elusimicrobiota bacterium]